MLVTERVIISKIFKILSFPQIAQLRNENRTIEHCRKKKRKGETCEPLYYRCQIIKSATSGDGLVGKGYDEGMADARIRRERIRRRQGSPVYKID